MNDTPEQTERDQLVAAKASADDNCGKANDDCINAYNAYIKADRDLLRFDAKATTASK